MSHFKKTIVICLAVLFTGMLFGLVAFAKTEFEKPAGAPPYGVYGDPDAQGTKLHGVFFIEYQNYTYVEPNFVADGAKLLMRLQKAGDLHTFYGEVVGPLYFDDPESILGKFADELEGQIIEEFFGAAAVGTMEIKIRTTQNFGTYDVEVAQDVYTAYVLVDVELAVK